MRFGPLLDLKQNGLRSYEKLVRDPKMEKLATSKENPC